MAGDETVMVEGGPLDGMTGTIHEESSQRGFFVHLAGDIEDPDSQWWGYFAHETRADGTRVFRPGRPKGDAP
jgi:hypothetical protein